MTERIPVVVVGGGQAALALSFLLTRDGTEHVLVERDTVAHNWSDARWDSFCLVTPNWQCRLPGYHYDGSDPDGFMVKHEIEDWLRGYVELVRPPVHEHTTVTSVRPLEDGTGFDVDTSTGKRWHTNQVVVATGGYHTPRIPRVAERLPLYQTHSSRYRNAQSLPDGPVLVIGTGQSGAQIAEDLFLAGRDVHLAVGRAPRFARRYRGRDVIAWMHDTGHYAKPVTDKPLAERDLDRTNHYVTGRGGGHDIDLRAFARDGMQLHGRLLGERGGRLAFADDLGVNLDGADRVYNGINELVDAYVDTHGTVTAAGPSRYEPVWSPPDGPSELDVDRLSAVVWATGFSRDDRWLHASVFDGAGHPQHLRGATSTPGLYFLGLPWLHTWGSGRFAGIETDAAFVAERIRVHRRVRSLASVS